MPSKRKRIGFLPRTEVQTIIDNICKHNNFSQSKVTGILVEEALNHRGLLNTYGDKKSFDENCIKDEVQMINDFIEFKFFKNIMNKNKKNYKK